MNGLKAITRAQWLGFLRDKQTLFWTVLFPLLFLFLFGAINSNQSAPKFEIVQVGEVSLLDQMPQEAQDSFGEMFDITHSGDLDGALEQVRKGDVDAVITMEGTTLIAHYSAADSVQSATLQGALNALVQGANQATSGQPPTFTLDPKQVEDESLKAIQYLAPGLLSWAIAMGAVFGAAMPLVQWRTTKMLRRLRLAPVSTAAIITSRALIAVVVAVVQIALFLGFGVAVFGLKLTGFWWLSIPFAIIATLAFMAVGLLVGAVSKTPDSASGMANVIILPMAFLSGSFFPLDFAPDWLNTISYIMPLRYVNEGMMDVMVRGEGIGALAIPSLVLLGFGAVMTLIAVRFFRWETDAR